MNKLYYRVGFDILKRTLLLLSVLYLSLTNLTHAQTPAWTELISNGNTPSAPVIRYGHTAVYDTTNNRMTIFGGYGYDNSPLNDVWVLSTANGLGGTPSWTQLFPTGGNSSTTRAEHTAIYDTANNRMTIFGGYIDTSPYFLNDVWVLSTANGLGGTPAWTQLFPNPDPTQTTNGFEGLPAPRDSHTAIYDPDNDQMTIFGGTKIGSGLGLNDTWVLSHANGLGGTPAWTQLSPTGTAPASRSGHTSIYDSSNNFMIIFGGFGNTADYLNDVWVLSNANGLGNSSWTQLYPNPDPTQTTNGYGGFPTPRESHTAVYDNINNRMIIFGGNYYNDSNYLNDVWVLSNANGLGGTPAWTQLFPTGSSPTTRWLHTAVYDTHNNRMTIFAGENDGSYLNDVWVLSNANGLPTPVENWMLYARESEAMKE